MLVEILQHESTGSYWRTRFAAPEIATAYQPGQFIMVNVHIGQVGSSFDPLLRRPFSLLETNPTEGWIDVLFKVKGRGTRLMSGWHVGETVDIAGPFGHGFDLHLSGRSFVLVGGGVGVPPLYTVADELVKRAPAPEIRLLLGGRSKEDIYVRSIDGMNVSVATEDGSKGTKGLVTNLLKTVLSSASVLKPVILTCGPTPMMKAVAEIAAAHNVPCQVSLENRMACAIGTCLGCVVPMAEGREKPYERVCTEGPVFDAAWLGWSSENWPRA